MAELALMRSAVLHNHKEHDPMSLLHIPHRRTPAEREAHRNAATIRAIPLRYFATNVDLAQRTRAWLVARADAGEEMYAYHPACGPTIEPRWLVWIQTANPEDEMRHLPSECAALYVAARAQAWLAADAGDTSADGEVRA